MNVTSSRTIGCWPAYLERIPVVTIDGAEGFELFVDEARLERALATPRLSPRHQ